MTKNQILTQIAQKHCFVETLERRGCDDYDFHDIGVANLKSALEEAFEAGKQWSDSKAGQAETTKKLNKFLKEGWARVEEEKKNKSGRSSGCAVDFNPNDETYWK